MEKAHLATILFAWMGVLWAASFSGGAAEGGSIPSGLPSEAQQPAGELSILGPVEIGPAAARYRLLEGPLAPAEVQLFADAADGRWENFSLLGAALVASGVSDAAALARYEKRLASLADELRPSVQSARSPRQQAQAIFEFMHERILRGGYRLDSTSLAASLDQGQFNCVSASVLFNCLASRFGLCARGVEIPGHAMSRLVLPDGTIDVETTCPTWFRLMDDPQRQAELLAQAIGAGRAGPVPSPADAREVSPVELVATIYYNRGVDFLAQKQFRPALAVNAKALRLDPASQTARGNLLATLNNWAIALGNEKRCVEAVDLLREGLQLEPGYPPFATNYVYVYQQWIDELCAAGRFQEALDRLAEAQRDRPSETYFRQARLEVYRRWGEQGAGSGEHGARKTEDGAGG